MYSIKTKSLCNDSFIIWILLQCLKYDVSLRIIFILQIHPSISVQKYMLKACNFTKNKLCHGCFDNSLQIVLGIHSNIFIFLPIWLKFCRSNGFFFFIKQNMHTQNTGRASEALYARVTPIGMTRKLYKACIYFFAHKWTIWLSGCVFVY